MTSFSEDETSKDLQAQQNLPISRALSYASFANTECFVFYPISFGR